MNIDKAIKNCENVCQMILDASKRAKEELVRTQADIEAADADAANALQAGDEQNYITAKARAEFLHRRVAILDARVKNTEEFKAQYADHVATAITDLGAARHDALVAITVKMLPLYKQLIDLMKQADAVENEADSAYKTMQRQLTSGVYAKYDKLFTPEYGELYTVFSADCPEYKYLLELTGKAQ